MGLIPAEMLQDNITVKKKEGNSQSIGASGGAVFSANVDISYSGYTPIGIVGWTVENRNSAITVTAIEMSGTTASIKGYCSISTTVVPKVDVLYKKNE